MNFAYIDARSLLEGVLNGPQPDPIDPVPWELDERWKDFETELSKFKMEFTKVRAELVRKGAELARIKEEVSVLRIMAENSKDLKEKLDDLIDNYEVAKGLPDLAQHCGELAGKVEAMKKVLMDTRAERYGKFTCFVCMDRLVELFIDPCGHVMCERCWLNTRDKETCPGCRTRILGAKKIYTL